MLIVGLRLDDLGTDRLTWVDLRDFITYSPPDSAVCRVLYPDAWITPEVSLAVEIAYRLEILAWMQTKDGERGINPPERIPLREADVAEAREKVEGPRPDRMSLDDLKKRIPMKG